MADTTATRIQSDIENNDVMLYMKGTPMFPQCGFSARVIQILTHMGVPFQTANVLEDAELREGIKSFSQWPTIPQLYVKGEFVGGCDIISEMFQNGELETLMKEQGVPVKAWPLTGCSLGQARVTAFCPGECSCISPSSFPRSTSHTICAIVCCLCWARRIRTGPRSSSMMALWMRRVRLQHGVRTVAFASCGNITRAFRPPVMPESLRLLITLRRGWVLRPTLSCSLTATTGWPLTLFLSWLKLLRRLHWPSPQPDATPGWH
jgi:monothiol glutaredoxin